MNKGELPYRQIHMDFHTSPLIPNVGADFDADDFAEILKAAHVNSINLFAKCHHGMYYYPTKIGTMHPSLEFDLLGAQIRACRKRGIRTCIYTAASWNEDWCDRHPEWMQVSPEGVLGIEKPFTKNHHSWHALCLNNRAHIDYLKSELNEINACYKPDGYWIDIVTQFNCVCVTCMAEMKALDLNPQDTHDLLSHNRMVEIRFMKEIYAHITAMDSTIGVYFNGHPNEVDQQDKIELSAGRKRESNTYIDIESLPSEMWGYTHFPIQVNYLNKYIQELCMMNGKFHKMWGDFGSLRNIEALEYECLRALANGTKICIGDQLHPSGKIDKTVYQRIGQVFADIEEKEKYAYNSTKQAQIGVYTPNRTLHTWEKDAAATSEGVYRIMTELHYLFDFVDFEDDISHYELLILPDNIRLPDYAAAKINQYLKDGGKLLLTSKSGLHVDKEIFVIDNIGVTYMSEAEFFPRYMQTSFDIPAMDYVMYERGVTVKAAPEAEVLAYIVNPYFNRSYKHFCSHMQTPPDKVTQEPAVVKTSNTIYIANPLFKDYAINGCKVYKDIIGLCIESLVDKPLVMCTLPTTAELTLRKQENRYILHILNYIIQRKCRSLDTIEEKWPLYNEVVYVRFANEPREVYLAPQMNALDFSYNNGYLCFTIPEINGHQMVVIEE